jgi:nucleotidyltransferase/DNA polymerase involved in DNA repair
LQETSLTTTLATQPEISRLVGRRPVQMIQGVGSRYGQILRSRGIRTLNDLARFQEVQLPGISVVRLAEFKAKAHLILDLQIGDFSPAALQDRSIKQLFQAGSAALARDSQQSAAAVRQFETQLRILQAIIDEQYLASLTLRELLTEHTSG